MGRIFKKTLDYLYSGYERILANEVAEGKIPHHVAIIMDGNRRYASLHSLKKLDGHKKGADTTEDVIDWCWDAGVKQLTIYAFSTENLSRDSSEVNDLFDLIGLKLDKICEDERTHTRKLCVRAIGDASLLPEKLKQSIQHARECTKGYDGMYLNVAVAYGGRHEIAQALQSIARDIKAGSLNLNDVNEELISSHLFNGLSCPDVDLIIRTGNDLRTSNFLPWQASGSECAAYFCAPYWPEFRKIDLLRSIRTYQKREVEMNRAHVLRIVRMLGIYGRLETDEIVRISRDVIGLSKAEVMGIIEDPKNQCETHNLPL